MVSVDAILGIHYLLVIVEMADEFYTYGCCHIFVFVLCWVYWKQVRSKYILYLHGSSIYAILLYRNGYQTEAREE